MIRISEGPLHMPGLSLFQMESSIIHKTCKVLSTILVRWRLREGGWGLGS